MTLTAPPSSSSSSSSKATRTLNIGMRSVKAAVPLIGSRIQRRPLVPACDDQ
jgi:hypothetical protein